MSYIVTGGAGFIGSAFLAKLNQLGITDALVVDNLDSSEKWKNLNGKRFADYVHKDHFLERVENDVLPSGIEGIVHLGACSSTTERNVDYLMHNNYYYSKVLAEYALKKKIRFVYASSAATYGDGSLGYSDDHQLISKLRPLNPYGYTKNLVDLWALEEGHLDKICGIRFFNVYGPNEYHKGEQCSVVFKAWRTAKSGKSVQLFKSNSPQFKDGEQKRDFIYVKDCSEVLWRALQDKKLNGVFNLGTGKARSWLDLARAVFAALKQKEAIEFVPMPENVSRQYQNFTEAKMEKLKAAGAFPTHHSLEDGVRDYVVNYLEQPNQIL